MLPTYDRYTLQREKAGMMYCIGDKSHLTIGPLNTPPTPANQPAGLRWVSQFASHSCTARADRKRIQSFDSQRLLPTNWERLQSYPL